MILITLLVLLDHTTAFNTVDHNILKSHDGLSIGIKGKALKWFRSYLSDRSFSVQPGQQHPLLAVALLKGLSWGQSLFILIYMLPYFNHVSLFCRFINVSANTNRNASIQALLSCLRDVQSWMEANFTFVNTCDRTSGEKGQKPKQGQKKQQYTDR